MQVTDWEKINREDRQRHDQLAWQLGWVFTSIAIVTGVVNILIGRGDRALFSAANLLIGLTLLVIGYRARRRKQHEAGQ